MKYEAPLLEIVRFEFTNSILTASVNGGGAEDENFSNEMETEPDYDPFA